MPTLHELVVKTRSYRRFYQDREVSIETLKGFIDLARLSASARNAQPLKYVLSVNPDTNAKIFETLGWAGYLTQWSGPVEGERPAAYIIMLGDTRITNNWFCDHGIAAQSILLGATEKGLGGCIIASIKREELRTRFSIPAVYDIIQIIALGYPKENVVIDKVNEFGDIKYWRDEKQVHHVPKRELSELILGVIE